MTVRWPRFAAEAGSGTSHPGEFDAEHWYKDAVIYELHVRAFQDSDGDGIGDFRGLASRLDYLQDLGVTALWLLPFYPSPLRDDGYDISDYRRVHPSYGTLRDFRRFLTEAHRARAPRHHRARPRPHLRRAPLVPAGPARPRRDRGDGISTSGATPPTGSPRPASSSRTSSPPTGPGIRSPQALLLAPLLLPPAEPQLRQSRRAPTPSSTSSTSGSRWGSTGSGSTPCPTSSPARGPPARTSRRPSSSSAGCGRTSTSASRAGCCSPRPTSGPRTRSPTSDKGDVCHMAFHFPLMPRMFMAARQEDRFPIVDILTETPDAPPDVPVGALPPQPRRAHPRDGHRRGARLHVPGLRPGPPGPASTSASGDAWRPSSATTAG